MLKEQQKNPTIELNQIHTPFTVLMDSNGTGQLDKLRSELYKEGISNIYYRSKTVDDEKSDDKIDSFIRWFQDIGMYELLKSKEAGKEIWFLLDKIELELSDKAMQALVEELSFIQDMELKEKHNIHIVVTSHSDEFVSIVQKTVKNYEILHETK